MTLVELLLVLALLVIASSLTVPAIFNSFSSTRLRRAGDHVLSRWAEARAAAIESGKVQQFRFAVESGSYRVEPWMLQGAADPSGSAADGETTKAAAPASGQQILSAAPDLEDSSVVAGKLSDDIVFQDGQSVAPVPLSTERQVASLQTGEGDWSTPILFFPDGTASQATVVLANSREHYLRLTMRALTGIGRASDVLTRDELRSGATR